MKAKRVTDTNIEQRETKYSSLTRIKKFTLQDFLDFRESTNTLNIELFYTFLDKLKKDKI